MDPIVWVALIGAVSGVVTIWLTKHLERGKAANEKAATQNSETAIVVAAWKDIFEAKERELAHNEQLLANERAITATFAAANERLESENRELRTLRDQCRAEHQDEA